MLTDKFPGDGGFLALQRAQFAHDRRNHSDIICLGRTDRLKHYGLHYAKYAGRLARAGGENTKDVLAKTMVDAALVCLSAANTLNQKLDVAVQGRDLTSLAREPLLALTDAAGRFADACEKIDHLEDFLSIAREANVDVLNWLVAEATRTEFDLNVAIGQRRGELGERAFYASEP